MAKPARATIKKTKAELFEDLAEQIELLVAYCEAFDAGKHSMAKPISSSLAVLLNGDRGNCLSLLHQLGLRQRRFFNSAQPFPDNSRFAQCQLAGILVDGQSGQAMYLPLLSDLPYSASKSLFPDWWTTAVVRDMRGRTFSRMELVQEVRNTDGGSHLDAGLGETYSDFKSGRYMGWKVRQATSLISIPHPHRACLRQIAHETLLTLKEATAGQFRSEYIYSAKPLDGKPGVFLFGTQVSGPPGSVVPVIRIGDTELIGEA